MFVWLRTGIILSKGGGLMVMRIYFEDLSPGMRAKIDPASRLSPRNRLAGILGIYRHSVLSLERNSTLSLATRQKPFNGLKVRVTQY